MGTLPMTQVQQVQQMQKKGNPWRVAAILLAVLMAATVAWYLWTGSWPLLGSTTTSQNAALSAPAAMGSAATGAETVSMQVSLGTDGTASTLPTVQVQSPQVAQSATSASGNLALMEERSVPLAVGGIVNAIHVQLGDSVAVGDLLVEVDTTELQRSLAQAQLSVESAQISLDELSEPATAVEIAQAQASLATAEQNLADLQEGPSATELAAAQSSLASAQASYTELMAGPSEDELTQLSASLRKAEISLADAQRAYDQVAWKGDAGASSQASALQSATIEYESTLAAFNESTAAASTSNVQSALSSINNAQSSLESLLSSSSAAEIEAAEASVAAAQADLLDLQTGPTARELRSAEISLENSLISLESAQRDFDSAVLVAPVAGTVTAVNATVGTRSSADSIVVTLADTSQLELVISVAEADIPNVVMGQAATIEIDALPTQSFTGEVSAISPIADASSTSVVFPVTIRLTSDNLTGVLPGMNAVATLEALTEVADNSWLVPANAVQSGDGSSTVTRVRAGAAVVIPVTVGSAQGEWLLVQSAELQAGDSVVGTVTSSDDDSEGFGGPPSGGMMMPAGGGGGMRP